MHSQPFEPPTDRFPVVAPYWPSPPYRPQPAPAAPSKPAYNVAAIISLSAGLIGLVVIPLLFGPVAVIAGAVGHTVAAKTDGPGSRMSLGGMLLGLMGGLIALNRAGLL